MKTRAFILFVSIISSLGYSSLVSANPPSDALGSCMANSLASNERKELAKWIFFIMSSHPDIQQYSQVTVEARRSTDEYAAKLITRLLTENCATQAKTAVKADGQKALGKAFETVGGVAMQELMSNKEVTTSMLGYTKFLDFNKLSTVIKAQ
jgi:hypothetical protein